MSEKLAVHGGSPTVPEGMIKPWPPIDDVDRDMVLASLDAHQHVFGPNFFALEKEFAEWNGNRYVATTNSGTSALHMCVAACGCGLGDEIIVPAWSWPSSATCIIQNNAIPVFVDIDYDTMNMDVNKIEAAISCKTKAILVVHLHGLAMAMDKVMAIAARHNLKVIEDCCQGHGALYKGKKAGTWGHCAGFSCNQNKLLCAGEAGFFVAESEEMLERGKRLWEFGDSPGPIDDPDYHAYAMGWKYHNNDLVAAFARAQLGKLTGYLERIRENVEAMEEKLVGVPHLIRPVEPKHHKHNWYNYTLRFDMESIGGVEDEAALRDAICKALTAEGVPNGAWQGFILPAMTVFQAKNAYGKGHPWSSPHAAQVDYSPELYPVAEKHRDRHTCLVMTLRPPNGTDVAVRIGEAIAKVMSNVDQLRETVPA